MSNKKTRNKNKRQRLLAFNDVQVDYLSQLDYQRMLGFAEENGAKRGVIGIVTTTNVDDIIAAMMQNKDICPDDEEVRIMVNK